MTQTRDENHTTDNIPIHQKIQSGTAIIQYIYSNYVTSMPKYIINNLKYSSKNKWRWNASSQKEIMRLDKNASISLQVIKYKPIPLSSLETVTHWSARV